MNTEMRAITTQTDLRALCYLIIASHLQITAWEVFSAPWERSECATDISYCMDRAGAQ